MKLSSFAVFVIMILSLLILVSGCTNVGDIKKTDNLQKNQDTYNGKQVTVMGTVRCHGSYFFGEDRVLHASYYVDDDTGEIVIKEASYAPPLEIESGDMVRVTGIYHPGGGGGRTPGAAPGSYYFSDSYPHYVVVSNLTILKKADVDPYATTLNQNFVSPHARMVPD